MKCIIPILALHLSVTNLTGVNIFRVILDLHQS
jgi:hypothetical protein